MNKRIIAKTVSVQTLTAAQKQTMFAVFAKYYDGASEEIFLNDLHRKSDVILLIDKVLAEIKGFCTLCDMVLEVDGVRARGVFTGDTVLEKEYWGQKALNFAFTAYLWKRRARRPWAPLYWFLISKGYRTYLTMTNNCPTHYPRHDRPVPDRHRRIMETFASHLFPERYNPRNGLIEFGGGTAHEHLKADVAPVTESMRRKVPAIDFFVKANPHWERGDELVCLAEFHLDIPLRFACKQLRRMTWVP